MNLVQTDTKLQQLLDALSQLPGSILYRHRLDWRALPPGDAGQALTLDADLYPSWTDVQRGAPALMELDGTNAYYYKNGLAWTNNTVNFTARIRTTDNTQRRPLMLAYHSAQWIFLIAMHTNGKFTVEIWSAPGVYAVYLQSAHSFNDGELAAMLFHYNPATGACEFTVNGQDEDDPSFPSRVCIPATLTPRTSVIYRLGFWNANANRWKGSFGWTGFKQGGKIEWDDFYQDNNLPKPINQTTWDEWNGQPYLWHESGAANQNLGSSGYWTEYGNAWLTPFNTWT